MKIHNRYLFFLLLLFFSSASTAQTSIVDSLGKILSVQKEDANKVNILNDLSWNHLVNGDRKNSLRYANEALALAQKIGDKKGEGDAYIKIARMYAAGNDSTDFEEAFIQTKKAEKIFEGIKDKEGTAKCLLSYGNISRRKDQPLEALKSYSAALDICLATGIKTTTAFCYSSIGIVQYFELINFPEALRNFFSALRLWEELGGRREIAFLQQHIGRIYFLQENNTEALKYFTGAEQAYRAINDSTNMAEASSSIADVYFKKGNYDEALQKHAAAVKVFERTGHRGNAAFSSSGIGKIYEQQGMQARQAGNSQLANEKLNEALKYYLLAVKLAEEADDKGGICYYNAYAASVCIKLGRLADAEKYAAKSLQVAKQFGDKDSFEKSYYALVELDSAKGNYKQAFNNLRLYMVYSDSLVNEESAMKSMMHKLQYESDKNETAAKLEQEKKDASQRKFRNIQYLASAIFLLIAIFLFWNNRQKYKANRKIGKAYSELKSAQTQLIHAEKMASLGELTAGIAHEIQNPLNFVNNFSEVSAELVNEMNEELTAGNTQFAIEIAQDLKQNLEKINHHGKRAGDIVKGMLQHSRTSTGQKESVNINALCDEYLRLSYHGLRAKDKSFNAKFETLPDETIAKIHVVPQDLGRVILNLINNAFYAVNEKKKQNIEGYEPVVTVATKKAGKKIIITIADNGNGIPAAIKEKIFQPFFTTKPTGEGTGLGLSLSYDIVTKGHGGELKVETKENEGTTFIIILPA